MYGTHTNTGRLRMQGCRRTAGVTIQSTENKLTNLCPFHSVLGVG